MSTSLWPLCCEWPRSMSNARSASIAWRAITIPFACSMRALRPKAPCGLQAEPDESDVGPLSRGHRPDLLHVNLARDHLVPEPGHDLGEQLEPLPLLVRDQDTQLPDFVLSHCHPPFSTCAAHPAYLRRCALKLSRGEGRLRTRFRLTLRRRGALGGVRQGRRERACAGTCKRSRTPHGVVQRGPTAQGFILKRVPSAESALVLRRAPA